MAQKKLPVPVTLEEFNRLMRNTKQKHHKVAFLLAFASGLRISEVCNLEQRDIDLKDKRILVRSGKGGKDRIVPLPKNFRSELLKYIPITITPRSLERAFKTAAKKSGILRVKPTAHFHSLRHGFATHALKSGMDIQQVRFFMGHSNISTTSIYLHTEPKEALAKYEEVFG
jgi:integrase/recombinase XerD